MVCPNIFYIHTDQHTPFVTGCHGDPIVKTPNLEWLAAHGVMFDAAYCNSPICVPSWMSMLTGLHPYQNQAWTNEHSLDSPIPTHVHALGPDQLHDYTDRPIGDHSSNYIGGVGPNRGELAGTAGPHRVSLERSGPGQSPYEVHDEYVTAASARRSQESDEAFCLTLGLMMPHAPFVARKECFNYYHEHITLPETTEAFSEDLHPFVQWWRRHTETVSVAEEEILRSRAAYWALVSRVDDMIGQMLDTMRQNHLLDNTFIIYASDHGDMLGEHSLWWKHTFYEHSVRVPLIISWPGRLPEGHVASALDVNATMLDAGPALPGSSGRSLIPLMTDSAAAWDHVAYSEYCLANAPQPQRAISLAFEARKVFPGLKMACTV